MEAITKLKSTGLNTSDIARELGQTSHSIRLYERGKRTPGLETMRALQALGVRYGVELLLEDFDSSEQRSAT